MNSHALIRAAVILLLFAPPLVAQVAVFWQPGFPTIASQPVERATLSTALNDPAFLDLTALASSGALEKTGLLVLPYGSSVPADAWKANLQAVGGIYRYAMKAANINQAYTTTLTDPGILICPTRLPNATLYVLTSESNRTAIELHDLRSGKDFSGELGNGRAALLLISDGGELLASYNWHGR